MRKKLLLWALMPLMLMAQDGDQDKPPVKSPQEIQQELNDAEAQLQRAKEMFAPYYTGPLVTPSPSMVPPGDIVVSPYLYVIDGYAVFDEHRHSRSVPSSVQVHLQPVILGIGITETVDSLLVFGGKMNWKQGHFGGGIDDLAAGLGFLVQQQQIYVPQIKFTIQEIFPTGKYQNLSHNGLGLNGTGAGAYATQFGLAISKLLFWATQHPVNTRFFVGYMLSTKVHVHNFNVYGGGFGTRGTVSPGNSLSLDLGIEVSLTQRWVFATDFVYANSGRTKFRGKSGFLEPGVPASVGSGYSDNFSLAPAIEYNWTPDTGVIFGTQFSVYGRSSSNFVSGILSWYGVY